MWIIKAPRPSVTATQQATRPGRRCLTSAEPATQPAGYLTSTQLVRSPASPDRANQPGERHCERPGSRAHAGVRIPLGLASGDRSSVSPGFGIGLGVSSGVSVGVGVEPDPQYDPLDRGFPQVRPSVSGGRSVATDPLTGVSRWGKEPIGAADG